MIPKINTVKDLLAHFILWHKQEKSIIMSVELLLAIWCLNMNSGLKKKQQKTKQNKTNNNSNNTCAAQFKSHQCHPLFFDIFFTDSNIFAAFV